MRAFQRLRLLWLLNCHLLPRRLIKFVPVFCDAGQRGLQGVASLSTGPFVKVNGTAIPSDSLKSELFVRAWRLHRGNCAQYWTV